jgi:hypothetical protein
MFLTWQHAEWLYTRLRLRLRLDSWYSFEPSVKLQSPDAQRHGKFNSTAEMMGKWLQFRYTDYTCQINGIKRAFCEPERSPPVSPGIPRHFEWQCLRHPCFINYDRILLGYLRLSLACLVTLVTSYNLAPPRAKFRWCTGKKKGYKDNQIPRWQPLLSFTPTSKPRSIMIHDNLHKLIFLSHYFVCSLPQAKLLPITVGTQYSLVLAS